ncbi:MAG: selenide, water dikinase SelD [Actinobacteria bacterium]|nr:selenide, water dikinase SelD [Actinomycetota bacterium]
MSSPQEASLHPVDARTARPRLTQLSHGGGCACKLPQAMLDDVLAMIGTPAGSPSTVWGTESANLLVGLQSPDDAAVYAIDEHRAWIVTADFGTPVVDDPYLWGRIAATNALSDVYAMGGRPLLALNLLAWPIDLDRTMLAEVLEGGRRAVVDAGALIVGGHSIDDPTPKFGLVGIGEVERDHLLTKGGACEGDLLVLTKPLGVGIVSTAIKRGQAPAGLVEAAVESMIRLNANAADVARRANLRGGTDVTGYGLVGHLHEMAKAAGLVAHIDANSVPVLTAGTDTVTQLILDGCAPDGSRRTLANALSKRWFDPGGLPDDTQLLLADAQTSGGLLLAVPPAIVEAVVTWLHDGGDHAAAVIGHFTAPTPEYEPGTVTASATII